MRQLALLATIVAFLGACAPRAATATPQASVSPSPRGQQLASEAEHVMSRLTRTAYAYTTLDRLSEGVLEADCSGFVTLMLQRTAPEELTLIPKESDRIRPRAFKFFEFFRGVEVGPASGWTSVPRFADVLPGDILAWGYYPIEPGSDTGHVTIAIRPPERIDANTWFVRVVDASSSRHEDDTRSFPPGGVGAGTIHFRVDASGRPDAFRLRANGAWFETTIAIGRLAERT